MSLLITKIKKLMVRRLQTVEILDIRSRAAFKEELIENSRSRMQFLLIFLAVLEIANMLFANISMIHREYTATYNIGSIFMLAVCAIYSVLLEYLRRNKTSLRYGFKNLIVKSCVALLAAGMLIFIYADFAESETMMNYMIMVLMIGIMLTISWKEMLCFLVPITAVCIIMGMNVQAKFQIFEQMLALSVVAIYSGQLRFTNALSAFQERQRLSASNMELERLAETDQLTKLLNRRGLEKSVKRMMSSHRRAGESIAMLMLDIDHFKNYNDKYLHTEGDRCLSQVAECLKSKAKRSTDIVARYGGEEFVLVVQDMKPSELVPFALMLKNSIEDMKIEFEFDRPYVTVSIGLAMLEVESVNGNDELFIIRLVEMADKELYNAKDSGRNCVSYRGNIHR